MLITKYLTYEEARYYPQWENYYASNEPGEEMLLDKLKQQLPVADEQHEYLAVFNKNKFSKVVIPTKLYNSKIVK